MAALDQVAFVENTVVAGAHDFNAWNQLFTIFARDYLWQPEAFIADEINTLKAAVDGTTLNKGNKNALTVKLDQAYKLVEKDENAGAVEVLTGLRDQVNAFTGNGKLTAEQSAAMLPIIEQLIFNLGYWSE